VGAKVALVRDEGVDMSRKMSMAALCVTGAITAMVAPAAEAAAPQEFSITEHLDFNSGEFTFDATGPLCDSGTFSDAPRVFAGGRNGQINIVIDTVYICADGSGTFFAQKHVRIVFDENSTSSTGPIQLQSGTCAYSDLRGHGFNTGATDGGVGTGTITGYIVSQ
jgi:hypothetical protein